MQKDIDSTNQKAAEALKTAVPTSKAATELTSLQSKLDLMSVSDEREYYTMSSVDVDRQNSRVAEARKVLSRINNCITRIDEEKKAKPLADAKNALSAVRDQAEGIYNSLDENSLKDADKHYKSDLQALLGTVDGLMQSDDKDAINTASNSISKLLESIKTSQNAKKTDVEKEKRKAEQAEKQAQDDAALQAAQGIQSFKDRVQALQNIPSVRDKGLRAVCELAGGTYSGTCEEG